MMILLSQLLIRSWHISVIDQSNILLAPPIITIIRGDNNVLLRQWRVLMRTRFMCVTCLNHLLACWECSNYCSYHQAFQSSIFTTGNIIRDRKQYCSLAGHYTPSSWSWHHPSLHADIYKVAPIKLMVAALTDSIYIYSSLSSMIYKYLTWSLLEHFYSSAVTWNRGDLLNLILFLYFKPQSEEFTVACHNLASVI